MSGESLPSSCPARSATDRLDVARLLISSAAIWLRSASLRTSEATTAKPLPCSPARAASMAAFSASRSVCRAISSMIDIFSAISFIACTVLPTASPDSRASAAALMAMDSVCLAWSAFCEIEAVICSMAAELCSMAAACSTEDWDNDSELAVISSLPAATFSAPA